MSFLSYGILFFVISISIVGVLFHLSVFLSSEKYPSQILSKGLGKAVDVTSAVSSREKTSNYSRKRKLVEEEQRTTDALRGVAQLQDARRLPEKLDFEKAKEAVNKVLNLIYNRYEMYDEPGSQFFLTANNYGSLHWDVIKYKFAVKMLEDNPRYLMIFGGSSVTAGHDNHFNQSYPMIVQQRMKGIFDALGIDFQVHNIAQGANNCIPYTFCYESMGGFDPDFMGWEQSYNCGRDDPIFELVARISSFSKNKATMYYSASGAWVPDQCPSSRDHPPFSAESWTPEQATMFPGDQGNAAGLPKIKTDVAFLTHQKELLNEYHKARPTASRFSGYMKDDYHGVVPHGFNVWEPNPKCSTIKEDKEQHGCSGIDAVQGCKMRFMTHEASVYGSDNGGGARWHPSRAFHMLRGEAIVWLYTMPFLDAIYMVETALSAPGNTKESLLEDYRNELEKLQPSKLPSPKRCSNYICDRRPMCYTNFLPHYSNLTLSSIIVGSNGWELVDKDYPEWSLHYGFLDLKPMYISDGPNHGMLHLKIHVGDFDQVLLCGQVKESLLHTIIYLDQDISFDGADGSTYTPKNPVLWTKKKYLGSECKFITDLPKGDHVLSIEPNKEHEKHKTGISHVISWP